MNRSVVIGIVLLLVIIGGGVGFKVLSDNGAFSGATAGSSTAQPVKAEPLQIGAAGGYSLGSFDAGGKQVPLVKIPLDTWGGYAALVAANGGGAPSLDSLFYKKGGFVVELVPVSGAKAQLDGYAAGLYPIIWSSMDSLPLIYDAVKKDRRIVPQVFGIFDWSFGGDGIVVRSGIKTAKDLKGKKILTSGNTPYNFFLLWLLAQSDIKPSDVNMVYIGEGDAAKEAFRSDKSINAWVTWQPYLGAVVDPQSADYVDGASTLITSHDANQLIADVYVARQDFAKEHPEILSVFSEALLEAEAAIQKNPEPAYATLAAFYKLAGGASEAKAMVKDVHLANFPESRMFFNVDNPVNAYSIFYMAQEYYKGIGSLPADANYTPESIIFDAPLQAIADKGLFANQSNRVLNSFNKNAAFDISDLENQRVVLSRDVQIYFEAQRVDFDIDSSQSEMRENKAELDEVARQMSILGTTVVKLVGHLDTSKVADFKAQGQQAFIEASAQSKLVSKKRAEFVKKLLIERYKIDAERLVTEGKGWDQPIDETNPSINRRVEVRFVSFE